MNDTQRPIQFLTHEELRQRALAFAEQQAELRAALELWELQKAEMRRVWAKAGIHLDDELDTPATDAARNDARLAKTLLGMGRMLEPYSIRHTDEQKGQYSETSWEPGIWAGWRAT